MEVSGDIVSGCDTIHLLNEEKEIDTSDRNQASCRAPSRVARKNSIWRTYATVYMYN